MDARNLYVDARKWNLDARNCSLTLSAHTHTHTRPDSYDTYEPYDSYDTMNGHPERTSRPTDSDFQQHTPCDRARHSCSLKRKLRAAFMLAARLSRDNLGTRRGNALATQRSKRRTVSSNLSPTSRGTRSLPGRCRPCHASQLDLGQGKCVEIKLAATTAAASPTLLATRATAS